MKVIKPHKLGLLHRTFEAGGENVFTATLLVFFPLDCPDALLMEVDLWKLIAAELPKDTPLDLCMPKRRGEMLLCARAFQPRGEPGPYCTVCARLGSIDKTLSIVGDRRYTLLGGETDPEPFTEMPITWQRAYGGPVYAANPVGKGHQPVETDLGKVHPLPNVEHPPGLTPFSGQDDLPAGFGPYDFTWPQRFKKLGSYGGKWLEEHAPGFAPDIDWSVFNAAPEDQQIEGFFQGDEAFRLENLHPEHPVVEGTLPGFATRCFINCKSPDGEIFREIPTQLDTVWFVPHANRGILVFRGTAPVAEDDASDTLQIVAAIEDQGTPKPLEHYQTVLAQRIDHEQAHRHVLRESDLLPPPRHGVVSPPTEKFEMDKLVVREGLRRKNVRRRVEREQEANRERLAAMGLNPDDYIAPLPPDEEVPSDPEEAMKFAEVVEERARDEKKKAEKKKAEAEKEMRALCEKAGFDYDLIKDPKKAKIPRFLADREIARVREQVAQARAMGVPLPDLEAAIADPRWEAGMRAREAQHRTMYQRNAHHLPQPEVEHADRVDEVRRQVEAACASGESLANADLAGVDLAGLDLSGADFRGALMEDVRLNGSNLSGANLGEAVLARADLTDANLTGARLEATNFGAATLCRAKLDGTTLTNAVFYKANLSGTSFRGAQMAEVDLMEATFAETDFREVETSALLFWKSRFEGVKFAGARFTKCTFVEVDVSGLDFSGTDLTSSGFVECMGSKASFRGATLSNLRIAQSSTFAEADFTGARADGANFRGTNLEGASFERASLNRSDLSACNLRSSSFYRSVAKESLFIAADLTDANFVSANLMQAILQKSILCGADFLGANLFRADLAKVVIDEETRFDRALVDQARMIGVRKTTSFDEDDDNQDA